MAILREGQQSDIQRPVVAMAQNVRHHLVSRGIRMKKLWLFTLVVVLLGCSASAAPNDDRTPSGSLQRVDYYYHRSDNFYGEIIMHIPSGVCWYQWSNGGVELLPTDVCKHYGGR